MKKKILIITTGGTIAMKNDFPSGIVPSDDFVKMLRSFPLIKEIASIDVEEFSNIPSPWMTPDRILELAKFIDKSADKYDGFVITHGTDTLEESAYFLDLVLKTNKPVIITAAMRSGSDLGLDGPRNTVGSVRVACEEESHNKGVLVVMNDEIDCARDVVKTDTGKTETFETPAYGLLGIIDPDKVIFYREQKVYDKVITDSIDTNIDLIKCSSGMDDRYINCSIEKKAKAIVIEAFGRGNIPKQIVPAVERAMSAGLLVVVTSRTHTGRVLPEYGYIGGGKYLKDIGVILGEDLRGPKMRLKLMALFGKYKDKKKVRQILENN